jgi:hypothetical protein
MANARASNSASVRPVLPAGQTPVVPWGWSEGRGRRVRNDSPAEAEFGIESEILVVAAQDDLVAPGLAGHIDQEGDDGLLAFLYLSERAAASRFKINETFSATIDRNFVAFFPVFYYLFYDRKRENTATMFFSE